jgi:DNA-binding FadR family transcriptional regulator
MATATRPDVPSRPMADSNAKRAAQVADRIVEDVMALGWPVGEVLGSEGELLERYEVSRAVFREAVRLVEHLQVARTRRGPGGGLVITEPTVSAVIDAVVLYLHRVDAPLNELFEARIVLEEIASQLASERKDEEDMGKLRAFVDADRINLQDDPRALHALVASVSRNPALELFVEVLNQAAQLYSSDWQHLGGEVGKETMRAHAKIAEAVIAGDPGLARLRMGKHLQAEGDFLGRRRSTRRLLPDQVVLAPSDNDKGAEAVARNITLAIVGADMQPGDLVGTEAELIEREGVSRALLREAVRLLEHHHTARMRRGPGGGLFVMAPSANAVTDVAAIYLARRELRPVELTELRTGVEVAIVDLAATRIDADGKARIEDALIREVEATDAERAEAVHDLHAAVAAAAHNRVLDLVSLVLIRLSRLYQIERLPEKVQGQIRVEVHRTHQGIADAVITGDRELSRHRMRRHLEALANFMR